MGTASSRFTLPWRKPARNSILRAVKCLVQSVNTTRACWPQLTFAPHRHSARLRIHQRNGLLYSRRHPIDRWTDRTVLQPRVPALRLADHHVRGRPWILERLERLYALGHGRVDAVRARGPLNVGLERACAVRRVRLCAPVCAEARRALAAVRRPYNDGVSQGVPEQRQAAEGMHYPERIRRRVVRPAREEYLAGTSSYITVELDHFPNCLI